MGADFKGRRTIIQESRIVQNRQNTRWIRGPFSVMFALAKPGGIYLYQKVIKTADFVLKPAVFLELVT